MSVRRGWTRQTRRPPRIETAVKFWSEMGVETTVEMAVETAVESWSGMGVETAGDTCVG